VHGGKDEKRAKSTVKKNENKRDVGQQTKDYGAAAVAIHDGKLGQDLGVWQM
jgi:hypothetical protein